MSVSVKQEGFYYKNGGFVPAASHPAGVEAGRQKTMAWGVLSAHNHSGDMNRLQIKFDAMASHDITYVGIIQTARGSGMERWMKIHNLKEAAKTLNYLTEHGITDYDLLAEKAEKAAADFESISTSIKQAEHRMEQIAALKTHIINYAKTRDTYVAYRKKKAADKPAFRAAHETDLLLHEAAKRAFDAQGVKKLPTVKTLQAEYSALLDKKKAAYEDYKRLR